MTLFNICALLMSSFLLWNEVHINKMNFSSLILVICRKGLYFQSKDLGQVLLKFFSRKI